MPETLTRDTLRSKSDVGVLIVGHGTRSEQGCREFLDVVAMLARQLSPQPVEAGFLEIAEPSLERAIDLLAQKDRGNIVVAPLLLFAAGHAKQDIPDRVQRAIEGLGKISLVQLAPLGQAAPVVELSHRRYQRAVDVQSYVPTSQTALLLVGRGSRDEEATAEMRAFSRERAALTNFARVETCFLAMAEPSLEESIEQLGASGLARIVVQPHLLFHGELMQRLAWTTKDASIQFPSTQWVIADYLGPHALIVDAVERGILAATLKTA